MSPPVPTSADLRVGKEPDGTYRVLLNGLPLQMLLAPDGLAIRFEADPFDGVSRPVVELKFAAGALDVDLDAELVADILRTEVPA